MTPALKYLSCAFIILSTQSGNGRASSSVWRIKSPSQKGKPTFLLAARFIFFVLMILI